MLSIISTVIWTVFTAAGGIGLRFTGEKTSVMKQVAPPATVERLNVTVVNSHPPSTPVASVAPRVPLPEPHIAEALIPPPDPKITVPFPIAIKVSEGVIEATKPGTARAHPAPVVDHLTFGEGEGDQPAPQYPREAKLSHQEGTVVVQMTIGENGEITDAQVTSACPFPILNQAAVRAVRDTWHFGKGSVRYKDVEFVFELHQR